MWFVKISILSFVFPYESITRQNCAGLGLTLKDSKERRYQVKTLLQVHPMIATVRRTIGCVIEILW